ncbi:kinase-like protein [Macrolepiota fuliginosa MF-IS2]|uniref:Kinase-like protein n=1 Tax=Macrolepiota fuliginosa MF-IS2 TaxID=1400762 RepID=A0A9P5XQ76_9AGAR|nr:kinase-like protein [Macrolepiota fuliginosa MF-IS2]
MLSARVYGDLDNYDLVEEIGRGHLSVIHKVICTRGRLCSRLLALKRVTFKRTHESSNNTPFELLKLQQELHHPHILAIYAIFTQPDDYAQVMEYCSMGSLVEYRAKKGFPLPEPTVLHFLRALGNALSYLRDRQIVHRAVQPANIFLDANGTPKLSHFDSAIRLPSLCPLRDPPTEYTAPEIIRGQPGSFSADIWSLGCVILFMLSDQLSSVVAHGVLQRLDCTPQLRGILFGMLHHPPSNRLGVGALLAQEIFKCHIGTPPGGVAPASTNGPAKGPGWPPIDLPKHTRKQRRILFGSLGPEQLGKPLNNTGEQAGGVQQYTQPVRRVVSDPLALKGMGKFVAHPDTAEPGKEVARTINLGKRLSLAGPAFNADRFAKLSSRRHDDSATEPKPQFIDASCLQLQSQKTKDGSISVLRNRHIVVEFRDPPEGNPRSKVMVINSEQNQVLTSDRRTLLLVNELTHSQVSIYEHPVSRESVHRAVPSVQYTRESLPSVFWVQYQAASAVIDRMKKRTPKLVMHTNDGKFSLMLNGPPGDVEVSFSFAETTSSFGSADDGEEIILRIRYSEGQGLVELRRFGGGADGKVWLKKRMTSIFNTKEIPQSEWARLDDLERDGLARLITFSETCKTIPDLDKCTNLIARTL